MATPKVQEQPQQKVESQPAPQPETAPGSAPPETPGRPESQATTPAQDQANDGESDGTQGSEDGDQDDSNSDMRAGIGGGIPGWGGPVNEDGEATGNQSEAIVQLEYGDKSDNSFNPMAEAGGIGAGLLGLSPAHYEDRDQPGEYREDEYQEAQEETRPADRRSRRPQSIQNEDEERAHKAAVELGRRGGIKSGQARRIRGLKINPPQMQPVSAPPEPAKRRKRPYWFKPPRLPGQRA